MLGIGFGETVSWRMKPPPGPLGKLDSLWDGGVYLGVPGENIVGNKEGVWKTRVARWKPIEDRRVVGVPWRMSEEDPKVHGERCQITKLEQPQRESVQSEWSRPVPRNVHVAKKDLETQGYTSGCIGCRSILVGGCRQGQSPACRARMVEISEWHGQVREDTAEGQRVRRESRERRKEGEEDGDGGDDGYPTRQCSIFLHSDNFYSFGDGHNGKASKSYSEGRCDLEPEFKRARVGNDVEMCVQLTRRDWPMDSNRF